MDRTMQKEHEKRENLVNRIEAITGIYFEGQNHRGLYNLETKELEQLFEYIFTK